MVNNQYGHLFNSKAYDMVIDFIISMASKMATDMVGS